MLRCSELSAIIPFLPLGDFFRETAISNKSRCAICETHRGSVPRIFLNKCVCADISEVFAVNRWTGKVYKAQWEPAVGVICSPVLMYIVCWLYQATGTLRASAVNLTITPEYNMNDVDGIVCISVAKLLKTSRAT